MIIYIVNKYDSFDSDNTTMRAYMTHEDAERFVLSLDTEKENYTLGKQEYSIYNAKINEGCELISYSINKLELF